MNTVAPIAPKQPRSQRAYRQTKSGSAINAMSQPKSMAPQPRNLPHHHNAHHMHNPPARAQNSENEAPPPHTPKGDGKKRRRQRKVKDTPPQTEASEAESIPVPRPVAPRHHSESTPTTSPLQRPVYAGPTFHHSPAPASLPVPKLFSKSAPKSVPGEQGPSLQSMMEADKSVGASKPVENDLERLFRAHREQRMEQQRVTPPPDESSDDSSSDTSNRDVFFNMEPESPFGVRFPNGRPSPATRPQGERSVTEPNFTAMTESPPPNPNTPQRQDVQTFLYRSPYMNGAPMASPNASPSPSPASRSNRANHVPFSYYNQGNGSPVPRRVNYGHSPAPSNFYSPPQHDMRPRPPVFHSPHAPARQPHPIFMTTQKDVAPNASCLEDYSDMENSLRRILKLQSREAPRVGPVAI